MGDVVSGNGRQAQSAATCGSCGAPAETGDLCARCEEAFRGVLGASAPAAASNETPAASATTSGLDESLWSQLMNSPAPPPNDSFDEPPLVVPPPLIAPLPAPADLPPRPPLPEIPPPPEIKLEPIRPQPASVAAAAPIPVAKASDAKPAPAAVAAPRAREAGKPVAAPKAASTAVASRPVSMGWGRQVAIGAVGLIAAVAGIDIWIRMNQPPPVVIVRPLPTPETEQASDDVADNEPEPEPEPEPERAAPAPKRAAGKPVKPAAPKAARAPRAKAAAAASTPTTARAANVESAPVAPLPVVIEVPAAPAAPAASASAPLAPFYQTTEVSEAPRIETRVAPRLPSELKGRKVNEIVIVRALVSQAGRASRVTFLRRSKTGPELDEAIADSVNQWRFVPAQRRGEAVSCWLNFAVTVGQ
jgi:outer membrane biosynthesis protein TonB